MSATSWLHGKLIAACDWIDSSAGRAPLTVALVIVGLGLVIAERRVMRKARGQ